VRATGQPLTGRHEVATVAGLLAGSIPLLGIVAARLLLLMVRAVIAHLVARDHARVVAPLVVAPVITTYLVSVS
jgi:hypothetical protein